MFERVCTEAGTGDGWTPRELRTSFVSLMSHQGVSIEEIARLVGHATTRIRPRGERVVRDGPGDPGAPGHMRWRGKTDGAFGGKALEFDAA